MMVMTISALNFWVETAIQKLTSIEFQHRPSQTLLATNLKFLTAGIAWNPWRASHLSVCIGGRKNEPGNFALSHRRQGNIKTRKVTCMR